MTCSSVRELLLLDNVMFSVGKDLVSSLSVVTIRGRGLVFTG